MRTRHSEICARKPRSKCARNRADVTNGKTFEIAKILESKHVPFVFVSGAPQDQLPIELRSVPFIPKPFLAAQIESALQPVLN